MLGFEMMNSKRAVSPKPSAMYVLPSRHSKNHVMKGKNRAAKGNKVPVTIVYRLTTE